MNTVISILIMAFLLVALKLLWKAYKPIIQRYRGGKNVSVESRQLLEIMENREGKFGAGEIARAFVCLLQNSYVLIHTMINEGNKYNDEIQTELFCASLDQDVISSLNSLEGKYE